MRFLFFFGGGGGNDKKHYGKIVSVDLSVQLIQLPECGNENFEAYEKFHIAKAA